MPITKSAIKKLRVDKKRTAVNKVVRSRANSLVGAIRKTKNAVDLPAVFSALDKAAKRRIFHPRKADRLKSRIAKLFSSK